MNAYTPGPWAVQSPNGEWDATDAAASCSEWIGITDARGDAVALVVASDDDFFVDDRVSPNAHLIAAAPELLTALECENALDVHPDIGWTILEKHGWDREKRLDLPATEFVRRLRQTAIAKATGGSR